MAVSNLGKIVEVFYSTMLTQPRRSYGLDTQLAVTFASGYLAGIICAVVSQPADTVVSKVSPPVLRFRSDFAAFFLKEACEIGLGYDWSRPLYGWIS